MANETNFGKKLTITLAALLIIGGLGAGVYHFYPQLAVSQTNGNVATNGDNAPNPYAEMDSDTVLASVNEEEITLADVREEIAKLPPQVRQQNNEARLVPLIVNQMINTDLLTDAAYAAGLLENEAVQDRLKQTEAQLVREFYVRQMIEGQITEDKLRARFEEFLFETPRQTEVKARHILVDDQAKANELIQELNDGAEFADLAAEHSTGPSAERGGDLGYFTARDMVPAFAEAAFSLDPGQITQEPVKTQFGWHIIKMEDRRKQPKPSFEEVEPQLRAQMTESILQEKLAELREAENVTLNLPQATANAVEDAVEQAMPATDQNGGENTADDGSDQ